MSTTVVSTPDRPTGRSPQQTDQSTEAAAYARRRKFRPYFVLAPALVLTIGILIPFFAAIYLSFTDYSLNQSESSLIGFDNYVSMF
jgi:multiple sugar transport system permease protein